MQRVRRCGAMMPTPPWVACDAPLCCTMLLATPSCYCLWMHHLKRPLNALIASHQLDASSDDSQLWQAANMMRGSEARLQQATFSAWRDAHHEDKLAKYKRIEVFFMSREDWWRQHCVETVSVVSRGGIQRQAVAVANDGVVVSSGCWMVSSKW